MKSSSASIPDPSFFGHGWSFPPAFSRGGADIEMVSDAEDIQQSLQILLGTAPGERVMLESFGCDLSSLLFEEADEWLRSRIRSLIQTAIIEHEPRIILDEVTVDGDDIREGSLRVSVVYTVRATNSRFNMVFPFYLMEATSRTP
jgi:phage baseplate assembly protein W